MPGKKPKKYTGAERRTGQRRSGTERRQTVSMPEYVDPSGKTFFLRAVPARDINLEPGKRYSLKQQSRFGKARRSGKDRRKK